MSDQTGDDPLATKEIKPVTSGLPVSGPPPGMRPPPQPMPTVTRTQFKAVSPWSKHKGFLSQGDIR